MLDHELLGDPIHLSLSELSISRQHERWGRTLSEPRTAELVRSHRQRTSDTRILDSTQPASRSRQRLQRDMRNVLRVKFLTVLPRPVNVDRLALLDLHFHERRMQHVQYERVL